MKKRLPALLLALALALHAGAAAAPLFSRTRSYDGRFGDVAAEAWYAPYVSALYEFGLTEGRPGGFAPGESVTMGELVAFAARVRAAYEGAQLPAAAPGEAWYAPYAAFLRGRGLPDEALLDIDAAQTATRAQMAAVLSAALPEGVLTEPNAELVTDAYATGDFIADVSEYTPYQAQILRMYRQGLLVGTDARGSFRPDSGVTRAEVAALLARMLDETLRVAPDWHMILYPSAAGRTYGSMVAAPKTTDPAPDAADSAAVDALVRAMLFAEESSLTLQYGAAVQSAQLAALSDAFVAAAKTYCEQMYNGVSARAFSDGRVTLQFFSTACADEAQLAAWRAEALAMAIAAHDELWQCGMLTADMDEYARAEVYFRWVCDVCSYDYGADDAAPSHTAYGALVNGRAVCDGYTGLYNLMLRLEGIACRAQFNADHIWTVAVLDGTEYHIDVTWGDQSYRTDMSCFGMSEQQAYDKHPW